MTAFICGPCRERDHGRCRGGTWCDCHHRADTETTKTEET